MSNKAIVITNVDFDEKVTSSPKPVLIDFWAEWCAPCRMLSPVIDEIADMYEGKAVIGKVNIDQQMELAQQFGVMSIPTLLLFKDGKLAGRSVGVVGKDKIAGMIDAAL
ncbi:MAG: thioredoxin [Eubacteriales bacterium]|nr:thioredoxin [Eubacteriales bacterium]